MVVTHLVTRSFSENNITFILKPPPTEGAGKPPWPIMAASRLHEVKQASQDANDNTPTGSLERVPSDHNYPAAKANHVEAEARTTIHLIYLSLYALHIVFVFGY